METLLHPMKAVYECLWGAPMLAALLGTHLYFTVHLKFIQRKLPQGIRLSVSKSAGDGAGISPFAALSTALAATIGTGNIIGISAAIALGGPGAVFWCWITGILGIATCYAECFLSVKYRVRGAEGAYRGGPMYVLDGVLKQKSAAVVFAFCTILVSFGMGSSVQSHSISAAVEGQFGFEPWKTGLVTAVLAGVVILGGAGQITKVCTYLVPFMSIFYLGGCLFLLAVNRAFLLETFRLIVVSAFSAKAAAGGFVGTAVLTGMRTGISKGLFTNEAGLGSVPMAAASAKTASPVRQGLISMTGPFWDTVVMCAVTGLAIVSSMLKNPSSFEGAGSDELCFLAFSALPFGGERMLAVSLILFAFATIVGWNYYGECAVQYLWKGRGVRAYRAAYIMSAFLGAVMSLELVWTASELFNMFMVIPNLLCLWMLRKAVIGGDALGKC